MEHRFEDTSVRLIRPMQLIALFLAVYAATALSYKVIGIRNKAVLLMFVITWLASAAKQFSEIRLGTHAALNPTAGTGTDWAVILAGTGPWLALGFSQRLHPTWPVWGISAELPLWLTAIGVVLGVIAVVRQHAPVSSDDAPASHGLMPRLTSHAQILALAMLLMSGSLVVGLIVSIWLAMLRHAVPSAATQSAIWNPATRQSGESHTDDHARLPYPDSVGIELPATTQ